MSQPSDTPETDAQDFFFIEGSLGHTETGVDVNFARELERQRDAAREDARRLAEALQFVIEVLPGGMQPANAKINAMKEAQQALAAHEALTAKN